MARTARARAAAGDASLHARLDSPFQVATLGFTSGKLQRAGKMPPRFLDVAATPLQLAERGGKERILLEAPEVGDRRDGLDAALGTVALRYGDGPVERHHRRRRDQHESVVQLHDRV